MFGFQIYHFYSLWDFIESRQWKVKSIMFEWSMHADITWQNVGAQESLDDKVVLKECDTYDLTTLRSPTDYNMASASTETLQLIEDCAQIWIKQIEQVSYLLWESRIILFFIYLDYWTVQWLMRSAYWWWWIFNKYWISIFIPTYDNGWFLVKSLKISIPPSIYITTLDISD